MTGKDSGGNRVARAQVDELVAQRDYYRRRWLSHVASYARVGMARREVLARQFRIARREDALTTPTASAPERGTGFYCGRCGSTWCVEKDCAEGAGSG